MEQYIFLAEENGSGDKGESTSDGSINIDKSKVFNNVDTSNKDKANDASLQNAFNTAFIWAGIICVIVIGIIVSAALIVNLIIGGLLKGSI